MTCYIIVTETTWKEKSFKFQNGVDMCCPKRLYFCFTCWWEFAGKRQTYTIWILNRIYATVEYDRNKQAVVSCHLLVNNSFSFQERLTCVSLSTCTEWRWRGGGGGLVTKKPYALDHIMGQVWNHPWNWFPLNNYFTRLCLFAYIAYEKSVQRP